MNNVTHEGLLVIKGNRHCKKTVFFYRFLLKKTVAHKASDFRSESSKGHYMTVAREFSPNNKAFCFLFS